MSVRTPQGYAIWTDPDRPTVERDTFTCGHCGAVVFVEPAASPAAAGGWCGCCTALICPRCAADGRCRPLERQLEEMERRGRFLRSIGL